MCRVYRAYDAVCGSRGGGEGAEGVASPATSSRRTLPPGSGGGSKARPSCPRGPARRGTRTTSCRSSWRARAWPRGCAAGGRSVPGRASHPRRRGRGPRPHPLPRGRAPRREALERAPDAGRAWPSSPTSASRGWAGLHDAHRRGHRHPGVHGPRAAELRHRPRPERPLLARGRGPRDVDRRSSVPPVEPGRPPAEHRRGRAAARERRQSRSARGRGPGARAGAGQGPRQALPRRSGVRDRAPRPSTAPRTPHS